jgi:hypothetical protein
MRPKLATAPKRTCLWFSTREAQDMADMAGSGALDLSVLEHHTFPLTQVNEALDTIPKRHGGFTNFLCVPVN